MRSNALAASPESGVKVNMYSQLQEEIKKDMRRRTDFALGGENQFQFLIGCRSDSPTVSSSFTHNKVLLMGSYNDTGCQVNHFSPFFLLESSFVSN